MAGDLGLVFVVLLAAVLFGGPALYAMWKAWPGIKAQHERRDAYYSAYIHRWVRKRDDDLTSR
jgi:hypothetical protein